MKKYGVWIVVSLIFAGIILGTLGTWSIPLGYGISAFWPAIVVQVAGGIWFGGWGVLAAVLFPILTNMLANVGWSGILGFIPANFMQGLIPAWAFRHFHVDPAIPERKGLAFYAVWGALIPTVVGGVIGSIAVVFFGEATWREYPLLVVKWAAPNLVVSLLIGIPIMRELTPIWHDLGILTKGWWVFKQEDSRAFPRHFRDIPIQFKLVLAMCGAGLGPLLLLSLLELSRDGGNSTSGSITPLFLTISLVTLVLAVGFLSRETVRPLQELKEQVEALVKRRNGKLTIERTDEIGQLGQAFAFLLDDRRHAETLLQTSEEKYRTLVENLNVGVFQSTLDGTFLHANSAMIHLAGYDSWEDFKQISASSLYVNTADREQLIAKLKTQGHLRNMETRFVKKDGTNYWLAISAVLLKDNEGKPATILGSMVDITERKQAEAAQLASESNLQALINNREESIWSLDSSYNLIICNDYFRKAYLSAYNIELKVGMNLVDILSPELKAFWKPKYDTALSGERISFEFKETINGLLCYFNIFLAPILSGGNVTGASVLSVDITKQKRAEEALRENENLYRKMNENSPIGMHFYKLNDDNQLIFVDANPAADKILGVDNSKFIGKTIEEAFPPLIQTEVPSRYLDAAAKGSTWSTEQILYDDKQIMGGFEVRAFQTTPGNMVALFSDITARLQAEEALRESEERFRTLYDNATIGLYRTTPDGRILMLNPAGVRMLGFDSFDEIAQRDLEKSEYHAGTPRKDFLEKLEREGTIFGMEREMLRKDGSKIFVRESAKVIRSENGDALYYDGSFEDITERKRAENMIKARLELIEFSTNHSLDELLVKTLDKVCAMVNSPIGFYHFVESDQNTLSLQAWSTRTIQEYCNAKGKGSHYPLDEAGVWVDCVRVRQPVIHNDYASLPHRKGLPEGHAALDRELVVPIFRDGLITAILGVGNKTEEYTEKDVDTVFYFADVAWEIAERKRVETEREKLITELSAKNAELERFTYTVSHDLKSPIVTIQGFLGYLAEDAHNGNTARMENDIQRITNATDKMQELLRDLLELSRIGRMMNTSETIQFEDLVHDALEIVQGQLEAHQITILIQPNLPSVHGDRQRLIEVVQNLVDNAIKYIGTKPDPRIEIGLYGEENDKLIFFVRDNGIGIASEYHERIFGLFNKLDPRSDGTGVGLALVKRIVEVHGGRIWVESSLGEGSIFYFSLPKN